MEAGPVGGSGGDSEGAQLQLQVDHPRADGAGDGESLSPATS